MPRDLAASRYVCPSRLIGRVCFTPAYLHSAGNGKQMTNRATLSLIGGGESGKEKSQGRFAELLPRVGRRNRGRGEEGEERKREEEKRRLEEKGEEENLEEGAETIVRTFCYRICMAACSYSRGYCWYFNSYGSNRSRPVVQ